MRKFLLILFLIPVFASAQSPMFKLIAKKGGGSSSCDTDAAAFITLLGLTGTDSSAICGLVTDLKDSSLWASMQAIYPMIGGTASTHKWNLKSPVDADANFRLVFNGGWTHSGTGALPNGSTGYAQTFYIPFTNGMNDSSHISYYSRTVGSSGESMIEMGCFGTTSRENQLILRFSDGMYFEPNSVNGGFITASNTDASGYFIASRIASNAMIGQRNTTQLTGTAAGLLNDYEIYIGARNTSGTAGFFSNRECAFATIGLGLSAAQMLTLNTIVERFQDALGRGVQ